MRIPRFSLFKDKNSKNKLKIEHSYIAAFTCTFVASCNLFLKHFVSLITNVGN